MGRWKLGVGMFVGFTLTTVLNAGATPQDRNGAIGRALGHVAAQAALIHADADHAFTARDVIVDADGTEHVRLDRRYKGLRVIGGDLVVHGTSSGAFVGVSETLDADIVLDVRPIAGAAIARRQASLRFAGVPASARAELVVYARGQAPVLAWDALVTGLKSDDTPSELHVIVDATNGAVLDAWDGVETAASTGTGKGFFDGTVTLTTDSIAGGFALRDPSRGNQYTIDMNNRTSGGILFTDADNTWGDFTLANRQTVAVDAQYGTAETWDYYKNVHGRNGIGNDGVGAYNRVHYSRKYNNAFWSDSCFCMTYGDGDGRTFNPFDSLDVAGHEMSHGVTSRTANLTYSGESGGLNEGNSDIFGTMVEFYANNPNDTPDYKIGEELYQSGTGALRLMYKPSADGASADCWYSNVGSLNVHYSSGVANHLYYLLAEGTSPSGGPTSPTCVAGNTRVATGTGALSGIGRAKGEKIWYRALTVYMTSSTNYKGARTATLNAAADLYGSGSAEQAAVAAAWTAVNVN
jgi:zinc metalloprotease ZmpA